MDLDVDPALNLAEMLSPSVAFPGYSELGFAEYDDASALLGLGLAGLAASRRRKTA